MILSLSITEQKIVHFTKGTTQKQLDFSLLPRQRDYCVDIKYIDS